MVSKTCTTCKEAKLLDEFQKAPKGKHRHKAKCRACCSVQKSEYKKRRFAANPDWQLEQGYRRKYGMTLADYDRMYAVQCGRCALCNSDKPGAPHGRFCVDHDHQTGRVRALLCQKCNVGLGHFNDDPSMLKLAAQYITAFRGID